MSSKISELTALGETPADDDIFPIVDTSASQTKSVTYANLRGPTSAGTKVLIQEITLSTAGEFDFDNIPQDYDRLIIEGYARSSASATVDGVRMFVNADTTDANYRYQFNSGANGASDVGSGAAASLGTASGASSPANTYMYIRASLEDYADSALVKGWSMAWGAERAATNLEDGRGFVSSNVTGAVTRLRIRTDNHPTDGLTGTLRLYGEKSLTIADSETITVKKKVATITDPAAGEFDFDFTNFQDGDRIVIEGSVRSTVSSTSDIALIYFNADTTSTNYHSQNFYGSNGATNVAENAEPRIGFPSAATAPASASGNFRIIIEDYAGAGIKMAINQQGALIASGNLLGGVQTVSHNSLTDAITRIRIRTDNHSTDTLTGTLTAYIEKEGVLPVSQGPHVIESITLSTAGEFDFDNIPQGYRRLVIRGQVLSSAAAVIDSSYIHINGDTTAANYHHQNILANNTVVNSTETAEPVVGVVAGSTGSQAFSPLKIEIEGYAQTFRKSIVSETNVEEAAATLRQYRHMVIHDTDDTAITRIQIRTNNHPTDGLTGTLTLYGEY